MTKIAETILKQMRQYPSGWHMAQLEAFVYYYQISVTRTIKGDAVLFKHPSWAKPLVIPNCDYVDSKCVKKLVKLIDELKEQ